MTNLKKYATNKHIISYLVDVPAALAQLVGQVVNLVCSVK